MLTHALCRLLVHAAVPDLSGLMYLRLKMVLWRKINVNTASYVLRD